MEYRQIENMYKANGLDDFQLKNTEDLLKVHGINFKEVIGYNRLDDINRQLYEKFIVNIFNAFGLESRTTLIPRGIYYVEHIEKLIEENDREEKYYIIAGSIIYSIDRNGMKYVLHTWTDEEYKDRETIDGNPEYYLRFQYEHEGRKEWLHVISPTEWY